MDISPIARNGARINVIYPVIRGKDSVKGKIFRALFKIAGIERIILN